MRLKTPGWIFTILPAAILGCGSAFSDSSSLARQNPILREHFRERLQPQSGYSIRVWSPGSQSDRYLEMRIDGLIDDFLNNLKRKLDALKFNFAEVRQAGDQLTAAAAPGHNPRKARGLLRKSLQALAKRTDKLADELAFLLIDFDRGRNFRLRSQPGGRDPALGQELRFMEVQLEKAEQRIQDYFFLSENTVDIRNLQHENMLIYLDQVRDLSKEISKRFREVK